MFKCFVTLSCVATIGWVFTSAAPAYTTKYDNIDLDEILNNDRLITNYYKCLMEQGPCTPDGLELRKSLPDALKNSCNECTTKQQDGTKKVLKFLIEKKPEKYADLEAKYDPTGIYKTKYKAEIDDLKKSS